MTTSVPEHILLAVLRQLDNAWAEPEPASELLERLGVGLGGLRKELLSRIPAEYDRPLSTQTDTIRRLGCLPFYGLVGSRGDRANSDLKDIVVGTWEQDMGSMEAVNGVAGPLHRLRHR